MKNSDISNNSIEDETSCQCEHSCPMLAEIEKLKAENHALKQLVSTDTLTGLFNRRHMFTCLNQEYERSERSNLPTTIALIDLDHFKLINDEHGHRAGDAVLTKVGAIIKNTIRQVDIACRYGGEEFCVIFPSTYLLTAQNVAERIRKAIENSEITFEQSTIRITASIGLDSYTKKSAGDMNNVIENADKELYKAKKQGRNRVKAHTLAPQTESAINTAEKQALQDAFKNQTD